MGLPIGPGDPVNGGYPTCLDYMPDQLYAEVWRTSAPPDYWSGPITRGALPSTTWGGGLWSDVSGLHPYSANFAAGGAGNFAARFSIIIFPLVTGNHCNLSVSAAAGTDWKTTVSKEAP